MNHPTQSNPACSLVSGWATTMGRLLGPNNVLGIFLLILKDMRHAALGVEPKFYNLSITSPILYQLS